MKNYNNSKNDKFLDNSDCIKLYASGVSKQKIGKLYNLSPHTIDRYLRKNNIVTRTASEQVTGENNPHWKGESVGYNALHDYVKSKKFKPKLCECCGLPNDYLDLANISQLYYRDLNDWEYICRRCHMTKDGRINNLKQYNVSSN